jgi:FKBP-type peptidyl-prolyl cis-trans isomerases 1
MKRAGLFTIILFLTAIIYSSCKEDVYMDWKLLNDRYYTTLEDSLKDPLFHKTPSGVYYKLLHQGTQRHPSAGDIVVTRTRGSLIDGSVFENDTVAKYYSSCYKGLQEGLSLMQNGGHYIFYIPSKLGNDTVSTNSSIPPYSVLRYDVTLIESR